MTGRAIVVTWAIMDASEPTERQEYRDGCWRTVYRTAWGIRAVVWSRDLREMEAAKGWAATVDGTVSVLDDTPDLLNRARENHRLTLSVDG